MFDIDMAVSTLGNLTMSTMTPSSPMTHTTMSNATSCQSSGQDMSNSPISPGTPSSIKKEAGLSSSASDIFGSRSSLCKRKINFSHLGIPPRGHQPATVARRNARERNRVKQVNNGFAALKQHIPLGHRSKKMSKVETLKCAVEYIKNLKTLLDSEGNPVGGAADDAASFENALQQFGAHFPVKFEMGTGSGGSHSSSGSHIHHNQNQLSPTSSDDPSSPSYASEGSYVPATALYDYENYEPVSPEDDEGLLDAISWWQQS